ncbi:MAG: hypothetical protein EBT20_04505 [Alphaproteobacteria bacterium]|nr:hypothetical protein [Alphaproteobacteria bacterium]
MLLFSSTIHKSFFLILACLIDFDALIGLFFPASSNKTVVIPYLIHFFFIPCDIFSFLSVDGRLCSYIW